MSTHSLLNPALDMPRNDTTAAGNDPTSLGLSFVSPESYIKDYEATHKAVIIGKIKSCLKEQLKIDLNDLELPLRSPHTKILRLLRFLSGIIQSSMDIPNIPTQAKDYLDVVDENPSFFEQWFKDGLTNAAQNRDFEGFIKLKLLYPPESELALQPPPQNLTEAHKLLRTAWTSTYYGKENLEVFTQSLDQADRSKPYSNHVAIIQSSGAGKSRLVDEVAKNIFTLPFNIADASPRGMLTYPHRDKDVADYLQVAKPDPEIQSTWALEIRYYRFFISLFVHVANKIRQLQLGTTDHSAFATAWAKYLCTDATDTRKTLYQEVTQHALAPKNFESLYPDQSAPSSDPSKSWHEIASTNFQTRMVKKLSDLLKLVPTRSDGSGGKGVKPVDLILYFDEAQSLVEREVNGAGVYYHNLLRCINAWTSSCPTVIAVFLSTNTKFRDLAPPADWVSSGRYKGNMKTLQPPFVETPFDRSPTLPLQPGLDVKALYSLEHLAQFGRPLWRSLYSASKHSPETESLAAELLNLARSKLLGVADASTAKWDSESLASSDAAAAVLDVILNIDFGHSEAAVKRQDVLVKSHMRLVYSILQSREIMYSGFSSEPILAEAALYQMWLWTEKSPPITSFVRILEENMTSDIPATLIDSGERGEVVARALITMAYIRAVHSEMGEDPDGSQPFFSQGCSLIGFLKELFTENHVNAIMRSVPRGSTTDSNPIAFGKRFKNARVRFTHWVRAGDDSAATAPAAMAAFVRGMAMIGHPNQQHVDFIIPILLDKDLPITDSNITALLWQIKSREEKVTSSALDFTEAQLRFFSGTSKADSAKYPSGLPYVMIVSELGLFRRNPNYQRHPVKNTNVEYYSGPKTPVKPKPVARKESKTPSKVSVDGAVRRSPRLQETPQGIPKHPKYTILAQGCSGTIYKVIKETQRETYQTLLKTKPLFYDHPRQNPGRAMDLVFALKPVWLANKSWEWFTAGVLQNEPDGDSPLEETVLVGDLAVEATSGGMDENDSE